MRLEQKTARWLDGCATNPWGCWSLGKRGPRFGSRLKPFWGFSEGIACEWGPRWLRHAASPEMASLGPKSEETRDAS